MSSDSNVLDLIEFYKKIESQSIDKERYYIKAKLEAKINDVINHKNSLKNKINKTSRLNNVVNYLENKLRQMSSNTEELKDPFLLSVVGPGKYGKSTLINALLEREETKIDDLPKTWKIDIFYGSSENDKNVKIIKTDGTFIEKTREETNNLLIKEEEKRNDSEAKIAAKIVELKKEIKDRKVLREYQAKLKKELLYESDITELQIPLPYNKLLKHFRLVDTPGINQTLLGDTQNRINEYYSRANGVIWMLDATSISSGANDKVLKDIKDSLEKVGGSTENIIAVLNKIDMIEDVYGKEKALQVLDEAKKIYGEYFTDIIAISAQKAYDGIIKNNNNLIKESNINELIKIIQIKFQQKAQKVKLDSTNMNLNLMIKDCCELIDKNRSELVKKENERVAKEKKLKNNIDKIKDEKRKEIQAIIERYISNAKFRVDSNSSIVMDMESDEEKKIYINDHIIKINELMDELVSYDSTLKLSFNNLYKRLFEESYFSEYEYIKIDYYNSISNSSANKNGVKESDYSFNVGGTSIISSIGISALSTIFLGPIGIVLGLLAEGSGISKLLAKTIYLPKLKNNLYKSIDDITNKISSEMRNDVMKQLDSIKSKCDKVREETYEELYCKSQGYSKTIDNINKIKLGLNKKIESITVEEIILDTVVI